MFAGDAGDADKAFECLEGSITSKSWIENDADLDSLREDPRYRRLLAGQTAPLSVNVTPRWSLEELEPADA